MKKLLFRLLLATGISVGLVATAITVLFFLPRPEFELAKPRDFGWPLTSLRDDMYRVQIRPGGKLEIVLQHDLLPGITPSMLAWWYQQLPLRTYTAGATTHSYYHLFHPSEHGVIKVLEQGDKPGISKGALITRRERFGDYYSEGQARVISLDSQGMVVSPEIAGLHFGRIEHRFTATPNGTRYSVHAVLGSDLPLLGPLVNLYIRTRLFPEPVLKEWMRHQVEEVGSLPYFLPGLYQAAPR